MHEITAQELIQEMRIHGQLMNLHSRSLACHCECLGMNAENVQRAILNLPPVYSDDAYLACLHKWGLMTEKGEPA